jgi:hypothetical protein
MSLDSNCRPLGLATRAGWTVPNVTRMARPPEAMQAAAALWAGLRPGIVQRSLDGTYNCMGMIFSSRRTTIDPQWLEKIIGDDEYERLDSADQLQVGDIVAYEAEGSVTHVAIVTQQGVIAEEGADPGHVLLSQWGFDGEYFHALRQVPQAYGEPTRFFSDRKLAC